MYVYILSEYEEHGAKTVTATLDRSKLLDMVRINWPFEEQPDHWAGPETQKRNHEAWMAHELAGLEILLASSDEVLAAQPDGWNCQDGWGGMMLHVIRLV